MQEIRNVTKICRSIWIVDSGIFAAGVQDILGQVIQKADFGEGAGQGHPGFADVAYG